MYIDFVQENEERCTQNVHNLSIFKYRSFIFNANITSVYLCVGVIFVFR